MPSPSTTKLPPPKFWDEFEDICADVLKRVWEDPYIVRNGRSGQRQHGVDCFGEPKHLMVSSAKNFAGAQCKDTVNLSIEVIREEAEKAKEFRPQLAEYLFMTTAARDAKVQEDVRTQDWPFSRIHVMFWEDISLELSGHEDLLQKYFPGWMKRTTTEEQVLNVLLSSQPEDFRYDDGTGVFFLKSDVSFRIIIDRGSWPSEEFHESWATKFRDPRATIQPVHVFYGETRVQEVLCAYVDGGRHVIPYPKSEKELTLTPFKYHLGRILNHHIPGSDFDRALQFAGIIPISAVRVG